MGLRLDTMLLGSASAASSAVHICRNWPWSTSIIRWPFLRPFDGSYQLDAAWDSPHAITAPCYPPQPPTMIDSICSIGKSQSIRMVPVVVQAFA